MWQRNIFKLLAFFCIFVVVWFLRSVSPSFVSVSLSNANSSQVHSSSGSNDQTNINTIRGLALQVSYTADGIERYLDAIDEIARTGANAITLSTAGYQEHAGSSSISLDLRKCPTQEQFSRLIKRAQNHHLRVILMPVILLSNPRGSEWRGVICPPDWNDWFASYLGFIKYFAKVGLENDVYALVIGTELISTEGFRNRWIRIIDEVRKIYHGKLLYSANWDHYKQVTFWDKLDMIGVTTYYKLSDAEDPPLEVLLKNWKPVKKKLLDWQRSIGKPILFTEVGWCSQPGCSIEPWNYYRHTSPSTIGLREQKKCYEAFIRTWDGTPEVAGAIFWEWTLTEGGPLDYGYTPKGKPAMQVLYKWFRGK